MRDIEVVIDDLAVTVDADEWATNPQKVTELVRENRREYRRKVGTVQGILFSLSEEKPTAAGITPLYGMAKTAVAANTRVTYQGRRVNERTRQILEAANTLVRSKRYGSEKSDISLVQGSYNGGGVAASAGTHDGGGAGDITAYNYKNRIKVLRLLGCAAWYRATVRNLWSAHIHFIVIGDNTVSRGGKSQVADYKANRNGLANKGRDADWRPLHVNITFVTNSALGAHYAAKNTNMYTQPYGSSSRISALGKGSKFTVVAKVKNSYGNTWGVNPNGNWVDMSKLTRTKPVAKAKKAPNLVVEIATQNFAQNADKGIANWKANRVPLVNYIASKKIHVLLAQELPTVPRNWVNNRFKAIKFTLRLRAGGYGRYIFSGPKFKKIAGGHVTPKARLNGTIKPFSWFVGEKDGHRVLFVDVHTQVGSTKAHIDARMDWMEEAIPKMFAIAAKYNIERDHVVIGGDWNGTTGIEKSMEKHNFVSTHRTAKVKERANLKTTHGFTGNPAVGDPIDMIFVHNTVAVNAHRNYPHKRSDHSLVYAAIVL